MPQRDQTDESLRAERNKTDAHLEEKFDSMEAESDEIVRIARARADEVVVAARDDADRKLAENPGSGDAEMRLQGERDREDAALEHEHAAADAVLRDERDVRRRYLADFLAVERESTDADLIGERAFSDAAVEARDEVLAIVSHDLRSMLGGLALNAELLAASAPEGEGGAKIRKYADTSRRLIARMNRLISDLLDVAGIEAGLLSVVPEDVEVASILHDTIEAFEPMAAARQVVLHAEPPPRPLRARLDAGRIQQVLANLVSNALKFTPEGGEVSIRIEPGHDEIRFVVADTGVGIPADEREGIFERFRQVGRDRRGLGLGLYISKGIVEAHGGRIWAESEVGTGSTFHFVLPAS